MGLEGPIGLDFWWGLRATHQGGAQGGGKGSPPRAPKVEPTRAHLGAPTRAIKGGEEGVPYLVQP